MTLCDKELCSAVTVVIIGIVKKIPRRMSTSEYSVESSNTLLAMKLL